MSCLPWPVDVGEGLAVLKLGRGEGMLVLCYPVGAYGLGGVKKEENRQRKCRHCSFAFAHTPCLNLMHVIQQVPFVHVCSV